MEPASSALDFSWLVVPCTQTTTGSSSLVARAAKDQVCDELDERGAEPLMGIGEPKHSSEARKQPGPQP